jgi:putative ABC transport system ATP-binding protein
MIINLNQVCPLPMQETHFESHSAWKNRVEINTKENTLVIAPSGTGKTSLLAFLFGMRWDFSGEITLDGKDQKSISLKEWSAIRSRKISVIFQDLRLIPQLTVKENLLIKNQLTQHKTEEQIKQMLADLGIEQKWEQPCGKLSYGQQQRVAIVRALCQPFELLLADEPFSNIDEVNIGKASALIQKECKANNAGWMIFSLGETYQLPFDKELFL